MRALLWSVGLFAAALGGAASVSAAPEARPGEIVERIVLEHVTGAGMMRLLTRDSPEAAKPGLGGGVGSAASLVPHGVRGLVGFPSEGVLMAVGAPEAVRLLKAAARVADVRPEAEGKGEVRVTVEPAAAALPDVRAALLKLPEAGRVTTEQKRLVLVGKPSWVYCALRATLRLEIAALTEGPPGQP